MVKIRLISSLLLSGALLAISDISNAQTSSKVSSEKLMQTSNSWDSKPYNSYPQGKPELTILKITIPAHTLHLAGTLTQYLMLHT